MQKEIISKLKPYKSSNNTFLFSFEGIEGSGKTTQIKLLKMFLEEKGFEVECLREPGGTSFGEKLRDTILSSNSKIAPLSEAYLFASSRNQLLEEKILPYLSSPNRVVILDRYIDSSIAYQGYARELGIQSILDIHSQNSLRIVPQITLYLNIDLETSLKRQNERGNKKDYFEKEENEFHQKLINGFDDCAKFFPSRIKKIDASQEVTSVFDQIKSAISAVL